MTALTVEAALERILPLARRLAGETPPVPWLAGSGCVASPGRWPCCSFAALVEHELSGRGRLDPADAPRAVVPGWWARANIWAGEGPWATLEASALVLPWGGDDSPLRIVQTWDLGPKRTTEEREHPPAQPDPSIDIGHTWLAVVLDGQRAHRFESSIARRVRVNGEAPHPERTATPAAGSWPPRSVWWASRGLALPG